MLHKAPMKPGHWWVTPVTNPSYSGGRDQKDHSSNPSRGNSLRDPISKKTITKRAGGVAQGICPEFKPRYYKINK
jgi:hypothetical protein